MTIIQKLSRMLITLLLLLCSFSSSANAAGGDELMYLCSSASDTNCYVAAANAACGMPSSASGVQEKWAKMSTAKQQRFNSSWPAKLKHDLVKYNPSNLVSTDVTQINGMDETDLGAYLVSNAHLLQNVHRNVNARCYKKKKKKKEAVVDNQPNATDSNPSGPTVAEMLVHIEAQNTYKAYMAKKVQEAETELSAAKTELEEAEAEAGDQAVARLRAAVARKANAEKALKKAQEEAAAEA